MVPAALWEAVQDKLKASASGTSRRIRAQQPSLLTGRIFDGEGRVMTPSHANKAGRRYRYYVTRPDQLAGSRSEEHTSELQSLMRISYAVFCLKKKKT